MHKYLFSFIHTLYSFLYVFMILQIYNTTRKKQLIQARLEQHTEEIEEKAKLEYRPLENTKATANAYNTLFVGRLSYGVDELTLKREFSQYGIVKQVVIPKDKKTGKSCGYGFVEFDAEEDMVVAYK